MRKVVQFAIGITVGLSVLAACKAANHAIDLRSWEKVDIERTPRFVHLSSPYFEQACSRQSSITLPQTGGKPYGCASLGEHVCTVFIPRPEALTSHAFLAEARIFCKGWRYGGN